MRAVVALLVGLAGSTGCAFDPVGTGGAATDDAQDSDATSSSIDAPTPTPIDAPTPTVDAACGDLDRDGICDDQDDWDCGAVRPSVAFPATAGSGRVEDSVVALQGPTAQVQPREGIGIGVNVGGAQSGAYRIGEAGGRYLGCVRGNATLPTTTWLAPILFNAQDAVTGQPVALVYQHTSSCGTGWMGGAPSSPIIGYYCVRLQ